MNISLREAAIRARSVLYVALVDYEALADSDIDQIGGGFSRAAASVIRRRINDLDEAIVAHDRAEEERGEIDALRLKACKDSGAYFRGIEILMDELFPADPQRSINEHPGRAEIRHLAMLCKAALDTADLTQP